MGGFTVICATERDKAVISNSGEQILYLSFRASQVYNNCNVTHILAME